MTDYETKDSGKREEMPTGSVRDSREGKGRFELISPFALSRIAGVYERGAAKYSSRNWEKGQPFSRFLDSALRHLNSFAKGWKDEDHLAQAAWNIMAILHFQELHSDELDDMPKYDLPLHVSTEPGAINEADFCSHGTALPTGLPFPIPKEWRYDYLAANWIKYES